MFPFLTLVSVSKVNLFVFLISFEINLYSKACKNALQWWKKRIVTHEYLNKINSFESSNVV